MGKAFILFGLIFFLSSCSSTDDIPEPEMEAQFAFTGNWLGQWSDSLFPSISVSAKVQNVNGNRYTGQFFYNNNGTGPYTACCGGPNDGTIRFETDGDNVINFEYTQTAPDYKGGCPGVYTGSGKINTALNRLVINFRGEDCDGFHENGKITWRLDQ